MNSKDIKEQLKQLYPYRIELHAHTKPVSPCGEMLPEQLVQAYVTAGCHAVVITNHFNLHDLKGLPKEDALDYYLSGYEDAKKAAEKENLRIFLGTEIKFTDHSNEYLIFGVDRDILSTCYDYLDKGLAAYRTEVTLPNSVFLQAHPFRDGMVRCKPELLDGIEVFNMHPHHNSRVAVAAQYASAVSFPIRTVGTDYHHANHEALSALRVKRMPESSFDIASILRSGDYVFEVGGDTIVLP